MDQQPNIDPQTLAPVAKVWAWAPAGKARYAMRANPAEPLRKGFGPRCSIQGFRILASFKLAFRNLASYAIACRKIAQNTGLARKVSIADAPNGTRLGLRLA